MKEKNLTPTNEQLGGGLSEPEGNAGFKGVEYGSSTAPAGGEIPSSPPKKKVTKKEKTKSPFRRRCRWVKQSLQEEKTRLSRKRRRRF